MTRTANATTVSGVSISHPDRPILPDGSLTKLDLARYFERIAPLMVPQVAGRPLSFIRCPEGVGGECFFQKHWSGTLPPGLDTVTIRQSDGRRRPYVVVRDATGLVTLAQWGIIEIHLWGSLASAVETPDRLIFDLDPGPGTNWSDVVAGAVSIRKVLAALGLRSWVKTSGGKGLHVVAPVSGRTSWEQISALARNVAESIASAEPERFLSQASKAARRKKIFIDWLRNTRGATSVAPWSPRARAEGGVSTPIPWSRLAATQSGAERTVASFASGRLPADPWREMLRCRQAIPAGALAVIAERR